MTLYHFFIDGSNTDVTGDEDFIRAQFGDSMADKVLACAAQDAINQTARSLLTQTDWYVLRETDGGEPVPADIRQQRAEARSRIIPVTWRF